MQIRKRSKGRGRGSDMQKIKIILQNVGGNCVSLKKYAAPVNEENTLCDTQAIGQSGVTQIVHGY